MARDIYLASQQGKPDLIHQAYDHIMQELTSGR